MNNATAKVILHHSNLTNSVSFWPLPPVVFEHVHDKTAFSQARVRYSDVTPPATRDQDIFYV